MKILITGASSLVGFSILESLEGRRAGLQLVGIASDETNSESGRYDHFALVPLSTDERFPAALEAQIQRWQPDLILPGRDPDIAHLAQLGDRRPDLRPLIVTGNAQTAEVTLDKAQTTAFATAAGLTWAPTVVCGPAADVSVLDGHSLPWIVKPSRGSGSHGVFLLTNHEHVQRWIRRPGHVLQPLLGPARQIDSAPTDLGIPWFTDVGDPWLRSVQVVVGPDGDIQGAFCSDHTLRGGITQSSQVATDPEAVRIATAWASALAAAGWRGSLNIQMKVDDGLGPTPFEVNGRMSGATHGRLRLGFDEVALTLQAWTGFTIPPGPSPQPGVYYRPRAYPYPAGRAATTAPP